MRNQEKLITLKEVVAYSNYAEENVRQIIVSGLLNKYDKFGKLFENPFRKKGFFRLLELLDVYNIREDTEIIKNRFFKRKSKKMALKV